MYDDVYAALVDAGNATKSNEPSFDYNGPFVTHYHLTHPQNCLVVDEVGSDTSQKGDGHAGGAKYLCGRGGTPYQQSAMNDKHFTMLGFTALSGEPVLCLIIIAGVQEKFEVECGIDIDAIPVGDPSDDDYFDRNRGKGKLFPMGPECEFNGVTVPCMVRWSPSGSITSVILRDALATMDHYGLFDRSSGKKPFLLLDGHQSRFELPFMEYVTNPDHPWMVCIGIPYGTSMWQVADSKQQNGSFKIAIGKAKQKLLAKRLDTYMDSPGIYPTDIMSIVNDAWDCSFAVVKSNQTAIADRGWNPLNYCLLDDNDIKCTMTDSESCQYHMMLKSTNSTNINMVSIPMNGLNIASTSEQSLPLLSQSTISNLTDTENDGKRTKNIQIFDPKYLTKVLPDSLCTTGVNLNFSVGRSAEVATTVHHTIEIIMPS